MFVEPFRTASSTGAGVPLFWTAVVLLNWMGFCLRTRRLHDFDGTFLWLLVPVLALVITGGAAALLVGAFWGFALPVAGPLVLIGVIVLTVFDVVIGSKRTTDADGLPISRVPQTGRA